MLLPTYSKVDIAPELMERLITVANQAADAASLQSVSHFRQQLSVENKEPESGFDPVTIADRQAELAIKEVVQSAFPEHAFLGEEFGAAATDASEQASQHNQPMWIVDPIDGTRAYITGLPLWGTLIAVYDGEDVVLGILEQPILKERFIGTHYSSAYAMVSSSELVSTTGKQRLSTRKTQLLSEAIVQTTTPDFFEGEHAQTLQRLNNAVSMVRYGGDCYCYALLAMGFVDVVVERMLQPYDIAALIPIIRGAGGVVTDWTGGSAASGGAVVASANSALHDQTLKLLNAT